MLLWYLAMQADLCDKDAIEAVFDKHRYVTMLVVNKIILSCVLICFLSLYLGSISAWLHNLRFGNSE